MFTYSFVSAEGAEKTGSDSSSFTHITGVIKEVKKTEDQVNLTVETEGKNPIISIFMLTEEPQLYKSTGEKAKKEAFEVGKKVEIYYDGSIPRIAIYPAQIVPELVILKDEKNPGQVYTGFFNEQLQSIDKSLKLNISKNTEVVNKKGERASVNFLGQQELFVFYTTSTRSIPAQTTPTKVIVWSEDNSELDSSNYLKVSGVIKEVIKNNGLVTATLDTGEVLKVNKDARLFNSGSTKEIKADSLTKGQQVDAYYDKNKPMILIYPPQITPDYLILNDDKKIGFVKIGKFDKKLVSLDQQLKLAISKKTVIVNENGKKISNNKLNEKELIVFYNFTARNKNGYPEQTTPTKIIAVTYVSPEMKELQKIIGKDYTIVNGVKMIPLRKVAEHLGYEVISLPKQKAILLKKGNSSFLITRGEFKYSFNKSIRKFGVKPMLKGNTTYISEDLLEELLQQ